MGTIKLFGLGVRKDGLSPEEFHDYWRHPHGTWAMRMTSLRGYVQSHQIHSTFLGAEQSRFEMIAEIWLDNMKDLREFRQEPILVKYLIDDEPRFIDLPNSLFLATEEEVIVSDRLGDALNPGDNLWSHTNRPVSIKLMQFALAGAAGSIDEDIARRLGALRYVRCLPLREFHAEDAPFAEVHELWWPTVLAFGQGVARAPDAWKALKLGVDSGVTLLAQAERLA